MKNYGGNSLPKCSIMLIDNVRFSFVKSLEIRIRFSLVVFVLCKYKRNLHLSVDYTRHALHIFGRLSTKISAFCLFVFGLYLYTIMLLFIGTITIKFTQNTNETSNYVFFFWFYVYRIKITYTKCPFPHDTFSTYCFIFIKPLFGVFFFVIHCIFFISKMKLF